MNTAGSQAAPLDGAASAAFQRPAQEANPVDVVQFPQVGSADVAVFWDFENVRIPAWCPATTASECIRNKVAKYGRIVEKRLYYDSRRPAEASAPRSDLDLSGFTLVDCPNRNRKETLDKKLIVDVLCFAWERASLGARACVVLITSDGDYSYALARLRDIGVFTVIIYRPDLVAKVLIDNANVVMSWEYDVLGGPPQSQDEDDDDNDEELLDEILYQINASKPKNETDMDVKPDSPSSLNHNDKDDDDLEEILYNSASSGMVVSSENETDSELQAKPGNNLKKSSKSEADRQAGKLVTQPNLQSRGKFALFCTTVLNAQHRNVKEGISVYSSWADEACTASNFYTKLGEKDRQGYQNIRTLATEKGFVEWGRRNRCAPGHPVIKVKDRDDRAEGLSSESYLRLTYAGLAVLKPNIASQESDWKIVLPPKLDNRLVRQDTANGESVTSCYSGDQSSLPKSKNGRLFIGGLAWQTTEDSLRSYFKQFGPIASVKVMEGRGFGFVFFKNPNDAESALKRGGRHVIDSRSVDVKPQGK